MLQFLSDFIFLFPLFMSFIWIIGALIFYWKEERNITTVPELDHFPMFSILVPAHNEKGQIVNTLEQLMDLDYPNYEVIAIDDCSTDGTDLLMNELTEKHERIRAVYLRSNKGKAAAMNAGSAATKGEYILTLDSDTLLDSKALKWIAWHFNKFPRVGAVTGNPRVLNRTTLLAKIQTGEYSTIVGLIKRAQRILGKVLTVSGVIAAFRKQALEDVDFWDTQTITDDIDITWKLERHFWDVRYEPRALVWILVPESIEGLWRQRLRWAQGGIEVLVKNIDIWSDWRQRRLWPVYIEYVVSTLWAYCFWLVIALWMIQGAINVYEPITFLAPAPPLWAGSLLAMVCLMMFTVSLAMESRYDKTLLKNLVWIIWYPFIYWLISATTIVVAVPKVLLRKKGYKGHGTWQSPDRGLHLEE
ncbi:MAG: poly-beta-1,6-N-acetyl-D-glucosamine synthase [Mariprofundus sp.]|nr:poly-beta-1,6-N-acetyl-D-glucosamine synthase [Mariprofundus sp.]